MIDTGYPSGNVGLLRVKFEKAAARPDENTSRVFKNAADLANHVIRACNAGALMHLIVADALELGASTKSIHRKLRGIKDSQINSTCRDILNAHNKWEFFERTAPLRALRR